MGEARVSSDRQLHVRMYDDANEWTSIDMHVHPIDMTVTRGGACGWTSIGARWQLATSMLTHLKRDDQFR
jgi:hypothetical protein